jgi:hypothetical protein
MIIKIICLFIFAVCMAAMNSVLHEEYNFGDDFF